MTSFADEARALPVGPSGRLVLGVAGPPAAGKSTFAARLAKALGGRVLPMDGFHLDDGILEPRGLRPRKGAPPTFDVAGFVALLGRIRSGEAVYAPVFDRSLELSRAAALEVPADAPVVVEGNYLLHNQDGWAAVRPHLDACWFLDVPEAVLEARLMARWASLPAAVARQKTQENDLPNARLVQATAARADRRITMADIGPDGTSDAW